MIIGDYAKIGERTHKFIVTTDHIIAIEPITKCVYHKDIAALHNIPRKGIKGGGKIILKKGILTVYSTSTDFGKYPKLTSEQTRELKKVIEEEKKQVNTIQQT